MTAVEVDPFVDPSDEGPVDPNVVERSADGRPRIRIACPNADEHLLVLNGEPVAEPAGDQLPIAERQLPRQVQHPARLDQRDVGGDRLGHVGQLQAELGQLLLGVAHLASISRLK